MNVRTTVVAVALLFVLPAAAERIPLDAAGLNKESTHIVTGRVKAIYTRDVESTLYGAGSIETQSVLEIEVDGIEKGDGIKPKDIIYARCWRLKKRGAAGNIPGPSGHVLPAEGAHIRAYLARGKYGPTGQNDNGFAVVYPNGIETPPQPR